MRTVRGVEREFVREGDCSRLILVHCGPVRGDHRTWTMSRILYSRSRDKHRCASFVVSIPSESAIFWSAGAIDEAPLIVPVVLRCVAIFYRDMLRASSVTIQQKK